MQLNALQMSRYRIVQLLPNACLMLHVNSRQDAVPIGEINVPARRDQLHETP
jgi:hypothetical protein